MPPLAGSPMLAQHGLQFLPERDPYFAQVGLLLHCDGAEGATASAAFVDVKGHAMVNAGGLFRLRQAAKKFGTSGAQAETAGNAELSTAALAADLVLAAQRFTIELWWALNSPLGAGTDTPNTVGNNSTGGNPLANEWGLQLWRVASGVLQPGRFAAGNIPGFVCEFNAAGLNDGVLRHWCVERVNNGANSVITIARNGDVIATSAPFSSALKLSNNAADAIYFDSNTGLGGGGWSTRMDEVRLTTLGVARYGGANFTPPTGPFPNK